MPPEHDRSLSPLWMARIAIDAVIDIPADVGVLEIGGVIVSMASGALENSIVAGIRMAGRTDAICVAVLVLNQVWLKVAPVHAVVVWQVWHVVENPAAVWIGLFVPW